jgi:hypothetical protein
VDLALTVSRRATAASQAAIWPETESLSLTVIPA